MNRLFFPLLIGILVISACCDDNGDCYYENPPPFFRIQFDTSSVGFTKAEMEQSFVTVVNDSSQITLDTIFAEISHIDRIEINWSYEDEQNSNRDLRNHTYLIHIENQIDTVHNIDFQLVETIVECRQSCFPRDKFDVTNQDFQNIAFDFNGTAGQSYTIQITK